MKGIVRILEPWHHKYYTYTEPAPNASTSPYARGFLIGPTAAQGSGPSRFSQLLCPDDGSFAVATPPTKSNLLLYILPMINESSLLPLCQIVS